MMRCELVNEWSRNFWHEFHIIEIGVNDDPMLGCIEGVVVLFGFGICVSWTYEETEASRLVERHMEKMQDAEREALKPAPKPPSTE